MPTPKPPHPAAFRQQMDELVRAGRGVTELACEFGCNASSTHHWVNAASPDKAPGSVAVAGDAPLTASERQELLEPRRKLKQVQMERDILAAEARMAIFTWIEAWSNPSRRHSGLGQQSPVNFEKALKAQSISISISISTDSAATDGLPNGCFAPVDKPPQGMTGA